MLSKIVCVLNSHSVVHLLTRAPIALYKKDKGFRRYAAGVERALALWDSAQQEWADYISFLGRLLKVSILLLLGCLVQLLISAPYSPFKRTPTTSL
jgi:hypothetical protein